MGSESAPFWDRLFREAAASGWEDWTTKLLALIIVGLLVEGVRRGWKTLTPHLKEIWSSGRKLSRAQAAVSPGSRGLWLAPSISVEKPDRYRAQLESSKPIIVVANLKGGVGKTTTAANLIAHYSLKKGERVLGIDLDFQGSLTATCLSDEDRRKLLNIQADGANSKAARLISNADPQWLLDSSDPVYGVARAKLISSYYSLAAMENKTMIEWLLGTQTDDLRYQLARILHDDSVQRSFDRIIIDAPPRLTTGCVQAFCAATHVLIPTVLDGLSVEAVATFADQLRIHQELWPHLRIVGVVGTMTEKMTFQHGALIDAPLSETEADAHAAGRRSLSAALDSASPPLKATSYLPVECFVPDKTELGRAAGQRIMYATSGHRAEFNFIRDVFDRLGDEIDRRIKG